MINSSCDGGGGVGVGVRAGAGVGVGDSAGVGDGAGTGDVVPAQFKLLSMNTAINPMILKKTSPFFITIKNMSC